MLLLELFIATSMSVGWPQSAPQLSAPPPPRPRQPPNEMAIRSGVARSAPVTSPAPVPRPIAKISLPSQREQPQNRFHEASRLNACSILNENDLSDPDFCRVGNLSSLELAKNFYCPKLDAPEFSLIQLFMKQTSNLKITESEICENADISPLSSVNNLPQITSELSQVADRLDEQTSPLRPPFRKANVNSLCVEGAMRRVPNIIVARVNGAARANTCVSNDDDPSASSTAPCSSAAMIDFQAFAISKALNCGQEAAQALGYDPLPLEQLFLKMNLESAMGHYVHGSQTGTGLGQMTSIASRQVTQERPDVWNKMIELSGVENSYCSSLNNILAQEIQFSGRNQRLCQLLNLQEGVARSTLLATALFLDYRENEVKFNINNIPALRSVRNTLLDDKEFITNLTLLSYSSEGPAGAVSFLRNMGANRLRNQAVRRAQLRNRRYLQQYRARKNEALEHFNSMPEFSNDSNFQLAREETQGRERDPRNLISSACVHGY